MLFGLSEQLSPGATALSETVPEKLPTGATVMVEVTAAVAKPVTLVGLAETVKSVTWTSTVVVLDNEPLVLVTFAE